MQDNTENTVREVKGWAVASNFAFTVAGGVVLGWALERWVWPKATPWLILSFAFVGMMSGGIRFVKEAMAINKEAGKKR
ncbi:MAG: AtpZ/AtpI family protein [Planctomycetes bacterium]|nr:AtpZ/AtpI family protein [Planctomycetota bacterium]